MLLDECSGVLSCVLVATALTACVTPPVTAGWSEAKTLEGAACFPLAPTWLNEGIASFFEGTELEGDSVRLGLPTYLASRHLDVPTLDYVERALASKATRGSARALRALAYSVDSERARAIAELDQALKEEPTHPGLLALRLAFEFDTATPNATAVAAQAWLERVESLCAALRPVARAPEELAALAGGETLLGQYQQGFAHVNLALGDARRAGAVG